MDGVGTMWMGWDEDAGTAPGALADERFRESVGISPGAFRKLVAS